VSSTTIYFLTETQDFDQAESRVTEYLETESFFDGYAVLTDQSGPLEEKRAEIDAFIGGWEWRKSADDFLNLAGKNKADGDLTQCGYDLINAGQLYAQCLTLDAYVYNIDNGDYSIPAENKGWQAIAVDFHY
jgi:hypothetical protein